jgi:hypothetical protein
MQLNFGASFSIAQVNQCQDGPKQVGISKVRTSQVSFAQVGIGQEGPAQVGIAEVGTLEVSIAKVSTAKVYNRVVPIYQFRSLQEANERTLPGSVQSCYYCKGLRFR